MSLTNSVTAIFLIVCVTQLVLGVPPPPHEECTGKNQIEITNSHGDKECTCKPGFHGHRCEEFSCLHGGRYEHHGHKCHCTSQYFGTRCEYSCQNGGRYDKTSGRCHCSALYTGTYCQTDHSGISLCSPSPCRNGHCYHDSGKYFCYCLPGYTGQTCNTYTVTQQPTTALDLCHGSPCKNNGHCYHDNVEFYCNCQANYTGKTCENLVDHVNATTAAPVDYCAFGPCVHGVCLLTKSERGFLCYCDAAYTGSRCETELTGCDSSPCMNNGHCYDDHALYVCACQAGFTGLRCETNETDLTTGSATLLPLTLDPDATFAPPSVAATVPTTRGPIFEVCNEIEIILALNNGRVNHTNSRVCPNGNHQSEAVQLKYCSANNVTSWKMGVKVLPNCKTLPKYAAIAQFHNGMMTTNTAVFVVCNPSDEIEVFTQTCSETFKLKGVTWPESETYYTVEW